MLISHPNGNLMNIQSIQAFQIYDSRGNPTIESEVTLEGGVRGRGLVPSGASTGQYEALESRDGDSARFRGRSVFRAIENIHRLIAPALVGRVQRRQIRSWMRVRAKALTMWPHAATLLP
jgi:enolase